MRCSSIISYVFSVKALLFTPRFSIIPLVVPFSFPSTSSAFFRICSSFEFTFELLWKTLKIILEYKGIEVRSPRSAIKEAFKAGLIEDDEILLDMLEDRNLSSHIYSEEIAEQIFKRIEKAYVPAMEKLLAILKERL